MRKFLGKKWKQLSEEEKEYACKKIVSYVGWDGNSTTIGECIIDFNDNISISGELVEAGDYADLIIEDNNIFYDSTKGIIIENEKSNNLISLQETAIMLNEDESTLIRDIKNGFLVEYEDYLKVDNQWLFYAKRVEIKYREYDKLEKKLKYLEEYLKIGDSLSI